MKEVWKKGTGECVSWPQSNVSRIFQLSAILWTGAGLAPFGQTPVSDWLRSDRRRRRTGSVRTDTGFGLAPFGQTPASDWLRSDRHRFRTGSVRTDTGAGLVRFEVKSASVE